jgi:hypothetical protein
MPEILYSVGHLISRGRNANFVDFDTVDELLDERVLPSSCFCGRFAIVKDRFDIENALILFNWKL